MCGSGNGERIHQLNDSEKRYKKKLVEAARHWAACIKGKQHKKNEKIVQQLTVLNAPPELLARFENQKPELFDVWPENWPVIEFWSQVCNQWRIAPLGGYLGLDYTAIEIDLRFSQVPVIPEVWQGMKIMEAAAREVLNEK